MIARTFVDSNILIYAHDLDAGYRHRRAADCLAGLWDSGTGLVSTQVLQEFYVNVIQKTRSPLSRPMAREVVRDYAPRVQSWITPETITRAFGDQ
jgi:predicted nucleic acid-binding protein